MYKSYKDKIFIPNFVKNHLIDIIMSLQSRWCWHIRISIAPEDKKVGLI